MPKGKKNLLINSPAPGLRVLNLCSTDSLTGSRTLISKKYDSSAQVNVTGGGFNSPNDLSSISLSRMDTRFNDLPARPVCKNVNAPGAKPPEIKHGVGSQAAYKAPPSVPSIDKQNSSRRTWSQIWRISSGSDASAAANGLSHLDVKDFRLSAIDGAKIERKESIRKLHTQKEGAVESAYKKLEKIVRRSPLVVDVDTIKKDRVKHQMDSPFHRPLTSAVQLFTGLISPPDSPLYTTNADQLSSHDKRMGNVSSTYANPNIKSKSLGVLDSLDTALKQLGLRKRFEQTVDDVHWVKNFKLFTKGKLRKNEINKFFSYIQKSTLRVSMPLHAEDEDGESAYYYSFKPYSMNQSNPYMTSSFLSLHDVQGELANDLNEGAFSSLVKREKNRLNNSNMTPQCGEDEYAPISMDIHLDFDSPPKSRKWKVASDPHNSVPDALPGASGGGMVAESAAHISSFVAAGTLRNISLPPTDKHIISRRKLPDRTDQTERRAPKKLPVSLVGVKLSQIPITVTVEEPALQPISPKEDVKVSETLRIAEPPEDSSPDTKKSAPTILQRPTEDLSTTESTSKSDPSTEPRLEAQWLELTNVLNWSMETKKEVMKELCTTKIELHDNVEELTDLLTKFRKISLAFLACLKRLSEEGTMPELAKQLLNTLLRRQSLLFQTLEFRIKSSHHNNKNGRQECPFNVCQSSEGVRWLVERYLLGNLNERLRDMYLFIGALSLTFEDESLVVEELRKSLGSDAKAHSEMITRKQAIQYWNAFVETTLKHPYGLEIQQVMTFASRNTDYEQFGGNPPVDQMHELALRLSEASSVALDKVLSSLANVCQLGLSAKDAEAMMESAESFVMESTHKMLRLLDDNPDFQPSNSNFLSRIAGSD